MTASMSNANLVWFMTTAKLAGAQPSHGSKPRGAR